MSKIVKFERILCPVAEAHETDEGLQHAIALARSYGASLVVLTCAETSSPIGAENAEAMLRAIARAIEHSILVFPGIVNSPRLDWELIVVDGMSPTEAILKATEVRYVDLIVMGSRRLPHAKLLGSTANTVSRTAPCPVLVTRLNGGRPSIREIDNNLFRKLLVASDFSDYSKRALRYALSLAQQYQSDLHVLHVISSSKGVDDSDEISSGEGPYHAAGRRLHESIPVEAHLSSNVTHAVREGKKPYHEIVSYAVEEQIDLICLGAHGTDFQSRTLFGSNADRILRESPCAVLVVRPLEPARGQERNGNRPDSDFTLRRTLFDEPTWLPGTMELPGQDHVRLHR